MSHISVRESAQALMNHLSEILLQSERARKWQRKRMRSYARHDLNPWFVNSGFEYGQLLQFCRASELGPYALFRWNFRSVANSSIVAVRRAKKWLNKRGPRAIIMGSCPFQAHLLLYSFSAWFFGWVLSSYKNTQENSRTAWSTNTSCLRNAQATLEGACFRTKLWRIRQLSFMTYTIGARASKFLGVQRIFAQIFPNFPKKFLCNFCRPFFSVTF